MAYWGHIDRPKLSPDELKTNADWDRLLNTNEEKKIDASFVAGLVRTFEGGVTTMPPVHDIEARFVEALKPYMENYRCGDRRATKNVEKITPFGVSQFLGSSLAESCLETPVDAVIENVVEGKELSGVEELTEELWYSWSFVRGKPCILSREQSINIDCGLEATIFSAQRLRYPEKNWSDTIVPERGILLLKCLLKGIIEDYFCDPESGPDRRALPLFELFQVGQILTLIFDDGTAFVAVK